MGRPFNEANSFVANYDDLTLLDSICCSDYDDKLLNPKERRRFFFLVSLSVALKPPTVRPRPISFVVNYDALTSVD